MAVLFASCLAVCLGRLPATVGVVGMPHNFPLSFTLIVDAAALLDHTLEAPPKYTRSASWGIHTRSRRWRT